MKNKEQVLKELAELMCEAIVYEHPIENLSKERHSVDLTISFCDVNRFFNEIFNEVGITEVSDVGLEALVVNGKIIIDIAPLLNYYKISIEEIHQEIEKNMLTL